MTTKWTTTVQEPEAGAPDGDYKLKVIAEEPKGSDNKRLILTFKITEGPYAGEVATGSANIKPTSTPQAKLTKWAAVLLNMEIPSGFTLKEGMLVNRECMGRIVGIDKPPSTRLLRVESIWKTTEAADTEDS